MDKRRRKQRLNKLVKASDIMTRRVESVYFQDTIDQVAGLFVSRKISAAPVIGKEGSPVGVITKTDLARYDNERLRFMAAGRNGKGSKDLIPEQFLEHHGFHLDPQADSHLGRLRRIYRFEMEDVHRIIDHYEETANGER